jgi:endonuclease YncB( thermonuclease family)
MPPYAKLRRVTLTASLSLALLAALLLGVASETADLTGIPMISDGDTLDIGATRVRLEGIDAPETDQVCLNANGDVWRCGVEARDQLKDHVAGRELVCTPIGIDRYKRTLGRCKLEGEDLNGWMVQQGWALAYVKYSSAYVHAEEDARTNLRGLWRGAFIAPWDWRHRNRA